MKNLLMLGFLCSTLPLIGMRTTQELLDDASFKLQMPMFQRTKSDITVIRDLKSTGGLAALCAIHKSGRPLSQYIVVTTRGSIMSKGTAEDFHRFLTVAETVAPIFAVKNDNSTDFNAIAVSAYYIHTSCSMRAKQLAAEIPDGKNVAWVCEPIRNVDGIQELPVIDQAEQARLTQWAQGHWKLPAIQEKNLVSLDKFGQLNGTLVYPDGFISLEEKWKRLNKP